MRRLGWLAAGAAAAAVVAPRLARRARAIDLEGRVAVVTGGSRGLGLLIAEELLAQGARVAVLARDEEELAAAQERLRRSGGDAVALPCDVRFADEVKAAIALVVERFGRLDLVVNNAGIITVAPFELLDMKDFDDSMATHFWGPLHVSRAALPHLERAGGGRIVNVASIGGKIAVPHLAAYGASKAALVGLSDAMRHELAPRGIRVTTVCPGLMRTGSFVHARFKGQREKELGWFGVTSSLPLLTVDARRAARRIVQAAREGRPQLTYNLGAKLAAVADEISPGLSAALLTLTARLLPAGEGLHQVPVEGWRRPSRWVPSRLTRLGDRAARENHELLGEAASWPGPVGEERAPR